MTAAYLVILTCSVIMIAYGITVIYDVLKDIRNELRLMRTNGVSFDPPRRGR